MDTSAFLALIDQDDQYHRQASQVLERTEGGRFQVMTTRYVVVEAHAAILAAVGAGAAREFLREMTISQTRVVRAEDVDEERAVGIIFTLTTIR